MIEWGDVVGLVLPLAVMYGTWRLRRDYREQARLQARVRDLRRRIEPAA